MDVVVIGAGASGMMAAISAAMNNNRVTLLERMDRVGKKILATGNGRCNLTNSSLKEKPAEKYPLCDKAFVNAIFEQFGYDNTLDFFHKLGIITKSRNELIYPYSDQASSVLDALRYKMDELKINVKCNVRVSSVKKDEKTGKFKITADSFSTTADRVILSTGSKAQPKLGSDGSGYDLAKGLNHTIAKVYPGLTKVIARGDFYKNAQGVRMSGRLKLFDETGFIYEESGEVQFTDYGISGIVVMDISNRLPLCKGKPYIVMDLLSEFTNEELKKELSFRRKTFKSYKSSELLMGIVPKKLSEVILKLSGIKLSDELKGISDFCIDKVVENLKSFRVDIQGTKSYDEAQICLGGVNLNEINSNLESKIVKGLYFCGELIDLHGDCGGYNLQLCWSTGYIAGQLNG